MGVNVLHAQRMNLSSHPFVDNAVNDLLSLHSIQAGESFGNDYGSKMPATVFRAGMAPRASGIRRSLRRGSRRDILSGEIQALRARRNLLLWIKDEFQDDHSI